jgi:signal peptidase II
MSRAWPYFLASCAIVLADQITKWMVLGRLVPWQRVEITPFFNLVLAFNKGAAFSFLAGAGGWQTPLLVAFALVAAVVVSVMLVRSPGRRMFCAGLALILGGAVGNVIDRLRYGHVVDFLDLHAGGWHWPAFNVADSAITVGAALLILDGFRHHDHERRAGAAS